MKHLGNTPINASLEAVGLEGVARAHWNLPPAKLILQTLLRGEGILTDKGALAVDTGEFTGRSPKDRFIVRDGLTENPVAWGKVNQGISSEAFGRLHADMVAYLNGRSVFVRDAAIGADEVTRLRVRVVTEKAWSNLFVHNMFIRLQAEDVLMAQPDWHIVCAPGFHADPSRHEVRQHNASVIDFTRRVILIAGSAYTGEIKKGMFSVMNFHLPTAHNVFPMHCSANVGEDGRVAVFFGLSGTGKTTLSSDPLRFLIGDDEHGWGADGVFNMEGGCYAKTIDLTADREPQIYQAIQFGAMLENVGFEEDGVTPDYTDASRTENTRVSYPIHHIPGAVPSGRGGHPTDIFFLTCDAFGVLPPISRLDKGQAMYHFLSGYTAKVAGTEVGITEPTVAFSTCFGAPFMPLHPTRYAEMLGERMESHQVRIWLVNTGWTGGNYGVGHRIALKHTRSLITAAMNGDLDQVAYEREGIFGLSFPTYCPGVPGELLDPRDTWSDASAYESKAHHLAELFVQNFAAFESIASPEIMEGAPVVS